MIQRRGFLKLLGSAVAGAPLAKLAIFREVNASPFKRSDWITDYSDYFHIRIPAGKVLEKVELLKPCLIEFGEYSILRDCQIRGFANLYGNFAAVEKCHFDGSRMMTEEKRAVLDVRGCMFSVLNSKIQSNGLATGIVIHGE